MVSRRLLAPLFGVLYLVGVAWFLWDRHQHFYFELDPMAVEQMVWLFAHRFPLYGTTLGQNMLGEHFSVAFLACVPLVSWLSSYSALLALHVSYCGLTAYFSYRLAHQLLEQRTADLATLSLLLGPLLLFIYLTPTAYGVQGLAAGLWFCCLIFRAPLTYRFSARERFKIALSLLLMTTSYEVSLLIPLGVGLYLSSLRDSRKQGLVLVALSATLLLITVGLIVPSFREASEMRQIARYGYLLQGELPPAVTQNPRLAGATLAVFVLQGGWLGVFQPAVWLTFLPGFCANFLSKLLFAYSIVLHYQLTVLPGVFLTLLLGLRRFPRRQRQLAGLSLALSLSSWALYWRTYRPPDYISDPSVQSLWLEAVAQAPAEASVLAPAQMGAHLSDRREFYPYPGNEWAPRRLTEWILLDLGPSYLNCSHPNLENLMVRDFLEEANYQVRWRKGTLVWLQQGPGKKTRPADLGLPPVDPVQAGAVYQRSGFHARAANCFYAAAQLRPSQGGMWALAGVEADAGGNREMAKEAYRQALRCTDLDTNERQDLENRLSALN